MINSGFIKATMSLTAGTKQEQQGMAFLYCSSKPRHLSILGEDNLFATF